MTVLLVILYVLVCLFLIMVVLLQQGKGADLAGAFGGGGSQTSFGPRTTTNIMHRLTTVSFVLFVVLSVALAVVSGKRHGGSAIEDLEPSTAVEEPVQQLPADTQDGAQPTAEEPAALVAPEPVEDAAPSEPEG